MTITTTTTRRTATAAAGALVCTVLAVAISASPARASDLSKTVEAKLAQATATEPLLSSERGVATVAVDIDERGRVVASKVVGSTGHAVLDADALRTARSVAYPRGKSSRTIAIVLTYNGARAPARAESAALVRPQSTTQAMMSGKYFPTTG